MSDLDFLTSKIGWKDDWKTNKESAVRVQSMKVISNQVVLILTSIIFKSLQSCFDFLSYLIPHGHSLLLIIMVFVISCVPLSLFEIN